VRNKGLISVLIGAVIFGVLAATAVSAYLRNVRENTTPRAMVVAKVDIPLGAKITADYLTTVDVPKAATPDGTFTQPDQIIGRITTTRISAREPLIASRLAVVGAAGGLSAVIPEGSRAMAINVDDETGLAGFLLPGTLVDVLAVINSENHQGLISKIVLQKIKVLANGQNLDQSSNDREPNGVRTVTLQVTPDQSEKLALAAAEGKLRLALRNATDRSDEQTNGVTKQTILGGRALPATESAPPRPEPMPARKTMTAAPRRSKSSSDWDLKRIEPLPVSPQSVPSAVTKPHASVEVIEGGKKRTVIFP
jgi:pilus assembly protein CpaB